MLHALTLGRKVGLVVAINTLRPLARGPDHTPRPHRTRRRRGRAVETDVDDYVRAFDDEGPHKTVREQFREAGRTAPRGGLRGHHPAGGLPMLLFSREKGFAVGNAPVLNGMTVASKAAETAVKLKRLDGTSVSRRAWFSKPSPEAIQEFLLND